MQPKHHLTESSDAVTAKDAGVTRDKHQLLHSINIQVKAGRITGLIGPSGSGKTTLMRTFVGVQKISEGAVDVLNHPAGSASLRTKIGYVTQAPAVYADLTVRQNIQYFAAIAKASAKDVDTIIQQVRLEAQSDQLVAHLSGGQRARVSLAVALLGDPELLVLDEPTVGLDPVLRDELWQLFRELAQNGKTLIVSSHVMDEADRCDDIILIRDGRIVWNKTRELLLEKTKTTSVHDAFIAIIKNKEVS